jgi:hypothetical protein
VGEILSIPNESVLEERVIAQSPLPRQTVLKGSAVNLLVSVGRPKTPYVMPDLRGESLSDAQELLKKWRFRLGAVRYSQESTEPPGTVVAQSPAFGARVEEGATVSLTLVPLEESLQEGAGKFALVRYRVPMGLAPQRIQIVVSNREVFNQIQAPGSEVRVLVSVKGETRAQIYSDGTLVEEKYLQ